MLSIGFPLPFEDAIKAATERGVVLPDTYYMPQMSARMRAWTFSVARMGQIDQIQAVLDFLNDRILSKGGTFQDFKRQAMAKGWGLPRWRVELILRNHLQNAYQAGHWRAFDLAKKERPYLRYSAINDSRTRPSHRALNGVVRPVDDPFWTTHSPPLGHNCRCSLRSLTADEVAGMGGATPLEDIPAEAKPDPGWGYHPLEQMEQALKNMEERKASMAAAKVAAAAAAKALAKPAPALAKQPQTLDEWIAAGRTMREEILRDTMAALDPNDVYGADVIGSDLGKEFRTRMLDRLAATRKLGGKMATTKLSAKTKPMVESAMSTIPTSWIEKSNARGRTYVSGTSGRGWHDMNYQPAGSGHYRKIGRIDYVAPGESVIKSDGVSTMIHEYFHRLQNVLPEMDDAFEALHKRRTAGEPLVKLQNFGKGYRADEKCRPDGYIHPYMGKEYTWSGLWQDKPLEMITMSMERVLSPHHRSDLTAMLNKDPEMVDLCLGFLFYFAP